MLKCCLSAPKLAPEDCDEDLHRQSNRARLHTESPCILPERSPKGAVLG